MMVNITTEAVQGEQWRGSEGWPSAARHVTGLGSQSQPAKADFLLIFKFYYNSLEKIKKN